MSLRVAAPRRLRPARSAHGECPGPHVLGYSSARASTRPARTAFTKAAWSRSVWSA